MRGIFRFFDVFATHPTRRVFVELRVPRHFRLDVGSTFDDFSRAPRLSRERPETNNNVRPRHSSSAPGGVGVAPMDGMSAAAGRKDAQDYKSDPGENVPDNPTMFNRKSVQALRNGLAEAAFRSLAGIGFCRK